MKKILSLTLGAILTLSSFSSLAKTDDFYINNPYKEDKSYQYKLAPHVHTKYSENYTHAKETTIDTIKKYRDLGYGAISVTDHGRITIPENTMETPEKNWGFKDIAWIPGIELTLGDRDGRFGEIHGDVNAINVSSEETDIFLENEEFKNNEHYNWVRDKNNSRKYYTKQPDGDSSFWPLDPRQKPAFAEVQFEGTGIAWIADKMYEGGKVKVYIDGVYDSTVDLYSEDMLRNQEVYKKTGLSNQKHNAKFVLTDEKSRGGLYNEINVYAFEILKDSEKIDTIYGDNSIINYGPLYMKHQIQHNIFSPQYIMKTYAEDGAFVTINHPMSRQTKPKWHGAGWTREELDILFSYDNKPQAIEIGNAKYDHHNRTNYTNSEEEWDYLLTKGYKVWGMGSDDTHEEYHINEGWVSVFTNKNNRENLTKEDIMDSLFKGNYYVSQGPRIESCELVDDKIVVNVDNPSKIEYIIKNGEVIKSFENATTASYSPNATDKYVRVRVTRSDDKWEEIGGGIGKERMAWTNPFFIENPYNIIIEDNQHIEAPLSGTKSIRLKANVTYKGQEKTEELVWEIKNNESIKGIKLDKDGNLVIDSSVEAKSIKVMAKLKNDNSIIDEKEIKISKPKEKLPAEIKVNQDKISLKIGQTQSIDVTILPIDSTDKQLSWSSNNPRVAKVDSSGRISAVSKGRAIVTVRTKNELSKSIEVNVSSPIESVLPKGYVVVNDTLIDLNMIMNDPEILVKELNKNPESEILISANLNDIIENGSIVKNIKKIIDYENLSGKDVYISKIRSSYESVLGQIGTFEVDVLTSMDNVAYYSLSTDYSKVFNIGSKARVSTMSKRLPIFFYDKNHNLIGKGLIEQEDGIQMIIVDIVK